MDFKDRVGNIHQVGGIESYVVDNGSGYGSRVAWVNTGAGLRFKVAIDRGMDIVDAFYNQHSLAWISHNGLSNPRSDIYDGMEWLDNFPGGLLTTCGLENVGGPGEDENGVYGVHGRYSNLRSEVQSIIQPDLYSEKPEMSITGKVSQVRLFGIKMQMQRTISCVLGKPIIKISDKVTNIGNADTPHMLLYHCNFGWPLVDEGTKIIYDGKCTSRGNAGDDAIFNDKNDYKVCPGPMKEHDGGGEACGFIDPVADSDGNCVCGLYNDKLSFGATINFKKSQLPCLTNWQHWGRGEYVTGLEPGTNYPVGRDGAKEDGSLKILEPGESVNYDLEFVILTDKQ